MERDDLKHTTSVESGQGKGLGRRVSIRWNNLSLRARGLLVIAVPLAAMLSMGGFFDLTRALQGKAQAWVEHTLEVKDQIRYVRSLLADGLAAQRGHLLTDEDRFIGSHNAVVTAVPPAIARLAQLVKDNSAQSKRIEKQLRPLCDQYFAVYAEIQQLRLNDTAGRKEKVLQSKSVMDEIRNVLTTMVEDEDRLLLTRQFHAAALRGWMRLGILGSVGLGIIIAIAAALLFTKSIAKRIDRLVANTELLNQELPLPDYLWGADEIGRLGHSLDHASEMLTRRRTELLEANQRMHEQMIERERAELANRQILNNSLDVICAIDSQGRFTQVSRASEKLWGYRPDELIGRTYMEFVHPEDHRITGDAAAEIMSGKVAEDFENRYVRKDGTTVPVVWSANWSEKLQTMFCVARDASERRRA
jgi:PAS domain S-box-containing protein